MDKKTLEFNEFSTKYPFIADMLTRQEKRIDELDKVLEDTRDATAKTIELVDTLVNKLKG